MKPTDTELTKEDIEFGRWLFSGPCEFIAGAKTVEQIPNLDHPEITFCGLSNVGKSTLINALTGNNSMARVSHTPGRTQQVNFFLLRQHLTLVDLPGYGYAKVSKQERFEWGDLIHMYLKGRPNLERVCILMDARRGVKAGDLEIAKILDEAAVSYQIVLTKTDLVPTGSIPTIIEQVKAKTKKCIALHPEIIATSGKRDINIDLLRAGLARLIKKNG
jgi:GTP-binding protein